MTANANATHSLKQVSLLALLLSLLPSADHANLRNLPQMLDLAAFQRRACNAVYEHERRNDDRPEELSCLFALLFSSRNMLFQSTESCLPDARLVRLYLRYRAHTKVFPTDSKLKQSRKSSRMDV